MFFVGPPTTEMTVDKRDEIIESSSSLSGGYASAESYRKSMGALMFLILILHIPRDQRLYLIS